MTSRGLQLLVADELAPRIAEIGLDRPWSLVADAERGPGTGRGERGVVEPAGGPALMVKRCLRGGVLGRFNRTRYFWTGRFRRELDVSLRAAARGLPVAETLAVVLRPARPGWHAWSAARLVRGARDLAWLMAETSQVEQRRAVLSAALRTVTRLHDAGLDHPDLNLGNLVARREGSGSWEAFAVDLDRASLVSRPLDARRRRRALDRFERSWRKIFGAEGPVPRAERERLLTEAGQPARD